MKILPLRETRERWESFILTKLDRTMSKINLPNSLLVINVWQKEGLEITYVKLWDLNSDDITTKDFKLYGDYKKTYNILNYLCVYTSYFSIDNWKFI